MINESNVMLDSMYADDNISLIYKYNAALISGSIASICFCILRVLIKKLIFSINSSFVEGCVTPLLR